MIPRANEKLIEKINKLFALGTSSNEEEAKSALSKAHELLVRHNLSIADLKADEKVFIREAIEGGKTNRPSWQYNLFHIIAEHFLVSMVGSHMACGEGNRDKSYLLVGTPINVKLALHAISFLIHTYKRLGDDYINGIKRSDEYKMAQQLGKVPIGQMVKARNSYYHGLNIGFMQALEAQTRKEQEMGLIIVKDKDLIQHIKDTTVKGKPSNQNPDINHSALKKGVNDGKSIRLQGAVENKAGTGKVLQLGV